MARVEIKGLAVGVVQDRNGNARSGIAFTSSATVYAASTGATTLTGGELVSNTYGELPGWLESGVHTITIPAASKSVTFEVGADILNGEARLASVESGHPFQANHAYPQGAMVKQAGKLYEATVAFTSAATFNAANWTLITASGDPILVPEGELDSATGSRHVGSSWVPGPQAAAVQPDTLFLLDVLDERDALAQGAALSADYTNYLNPATAKVPLVAGPAWRKGVGASAGGKDHFRVGLDGLIPKDQWTLEFKLKSNGADYTAQPAGGAFLIASAQIASTRSESLEVTRPTTGVLRVAVLRGTTVQYKCDIALAVGNVPADTWVTVSATLQPDSVGSPTIAAWVDRAGVTYTGVFTATLENATQHPYSSGDREGGLAVNSPFDGATASGPFSVAELHIMRYARVRSGSVGPTLKAPTVSVDATQALDGYPVQDLAGIFAQYAGWRDLLSDQNAANRDAIIAAAGAAGMRTIRMPIIWDRVGFTGNVPTDFSSFDVPMDKYAAQGCSFGLTFTYCPPPINGGSRFNPPTDNTIYAQMVSTAVTHFVTRYGAAAIDFVSVWNEPATAGWWTGTVAQFVTMWAAVRAKLATDHPTLPLANTDDGSTSPYCNGVIDHCSANNLPLELCFHHDYSGSVFTMREYVKIGRDYCASKGFHSMRYAITEWNWDIVALGARNSTSQYSMGNLSEPTYGQRFAAFAYAMVAEMSADQLIPSGGFTRMGQLDSPFYAGLEESYGGLFDQQTPPHPFPVFAAFQALWKHANGQRVIATANRPYLRALASKTAGGEIVATYGTYRTWRPGDPVSVSLEWTGLPSAYTWKRYAADHDSAPDGRLVVVAQGDETNLPVGVRCDYQAVGAIVVTPAAAAPAITVKAAIPLSALRLAHYDAGQITGLAADAPVVTWSDVSGKGRHIVQGNAAMRPLYKTAILNGLPVVRFDGVDDYLMSTWLLSHPTSVFVVARWLNASLTTLFDGKNLNHNRIYRSAVGTLNVYANGAGPAIATTPQSWHVIEATVKGVSFASRLSIDGGAAATATIAAAATPAGVTVGSLGNGGGQNANADVAEVLIYPALNNADIARVVAYLRAKYAI